MNLSLDIANNPNETFENDSVIINLNTEEITWKPMMYNEQMRTNILYWLNERNN